MELSACIVVYNGADEALRAAQTVLDCTRRHPLTLYLVDNASPDGSGQCLAKAAKDGTLHIREDQKVEVLCRTENGGFGTGHNTVLSLLQSRVHFILNPDIQLTADTLSGPHSPSRTGGPSVCRCADAVCGPWYTASCPA